MPSFVTNAGADGLQTGGTIVWASDTIRARLVLASVTPTVDDLVMTGLTGVGTDQTLASKTKTKDNATDRVVYDAADVSYAAVVAGSTVGWIVIFKFVANDAGSTPIAVLDVSDFLTNGGVVDVAWAISGIFYSQQ